MRNYTDKEIIEGLRKALKWYADPEHHPVMIYPEDLCKDDCSGFYRKPGEIARQALNQYHHSTKVID